MRRDGADRSPRQSGGSYGPWLAGQVLGEAPAQLSFRTGKYKTLPEWRKAAKAKALEYIAPVDLGGTPQVTVTGRTTYDGLEIEFLSWQLPMGPRTEAVLLKPQGMRGKLPGFWRCMITAAISFLAGERSSGRMTNLGVSRRNTRTTTIPGLAGPMRSPNEAMSSWCTTRFRSPAGGFVSRMCRPGSRRRSGPGTWRRGRHREVQHVRGQHENVMEKSLLSAGTTWPGVYLVEDQKALDVLAARPEVDAARLGCAGLSGGGMRTVFLGGLDDRITVAIAVGFMTTWRDFLLDKAFTHTWMTYVPLLPKYLDFPEILALQVDRRFAPPRLKAGSTVECAVAARDAEGDALQIEWDLRPDVADHPNVGGDKEPGTVPLQGALTDTRANQAQLTLPAKPGAYRLFVYVRDGKGGAATANRPILVE